LVATPSSIRLIQRNRRRPCRRSHHASSSRRLEATPWLWTLAFGHHEDRTPTRGYEATREAAMAAFAKSWWRE
jgi:hypothetical protein